MALRNLRLELTADTADTACDWLMEHGALSASVEDADAGTAAESPIFAEPGEALDQRWQHSRVVALFDDDTNLDLVLAALANTLGAMPPYLIDTVDDADWVRLTQAQFDPIPVSKRLVITPTWHSNTDGAINIALDPGLAFGTGSHPTTFMCLGWLDRMVVPGESLLDYGCGSGILAIAGHKLGAAPVVAVDIDPQALQSTRDNAAQNDVELAVYAPDAAPQQAYDRVVANILANPLRLLAPLLAASVKPGGHIALAGLLAEQAAELIQIYHPWFDMHADDEREGWTLLTGVRRAC